MYLTRWSDFDRDLGRFAALDLLRRRMDEMFRDFDQPFRALRNELGEVTTWPRANLYDVGPELVLSAAVPGLSEKDISINATGDVLSISGELHAPVQGRHGEGERHGQGRHADRSSRQGRRGAAAADHRQGIVVKGR